MAWKVEVKEAAIDHLAWFGKKLGRKLLQSALKFLQHDPLAQTKNMKSLRPNPVAQRELRLFGKYRVTIVLVGEKRGNKLLVSGREFSAHESDSAQ
jgi:hypothetical protein